MAVHGVPRATGDLDVWVRPDTPNADRVWRALIEFGAPAGALGVSREDLETRGIVDQIGLPPRRLDIERLQADSKILGGQVCIKGTRIPVSLILHALAASHFTKSLRHYPVDVWALNNRGLAYLEMGKRQKARQDFEAAPGIDPPFTPARRNLDSLRVGQVSPEIP